MRCRTAAQRRWAVLRVTTFFVMMQPRLVRQSVWLTVAALAARALELPPKAAEPQVRFVVPP